MVFFHKFLAKTPTVEPDLLDTSLLSFTQVSQFVSIEIFDFEDFLSVLFYRVPPPKKTTRTKKWRSCSWCSLWRSREAPVLSQTFPIAFEKYRKQSKRLVVEVDLLYRLSYDNCGKVKNK